MSLRVFGFLDVLMIEILADRLVLDAVCLLCHLPQSPTDAPAHCGSRPAGRHYKLAMQE
jgi:hypothetical protein